MRLMVNQYRQQANEIIEARALYRKEALQRKLLFNEVQELKGNIRVFCRCRQDESGPCALTFEGEDLVHCMNNQGRMKSYEFEKVYRPTSTQDEVFEDTRAIITSCVDGYNVCIIAYGQTGSGKTYTMMGPHENPGVNIRSIKELFKILQERDKTHFEMKVSMVEVYNECIYDLLTSPDEREKLHIQNKGKNINIQGLTECIVTSTDDIKKIMTVGENNRTTASTKMNTNSSRSHLLLILLLKSYNSVSQMTTHGRLTLVDLAGSERISRSEATGLRLTEAAAINKSLSALGQVYGSIRDGALHIPFRNSKLTHLLQPCLGGNAKACMFVNVSPLETNHAETTSTLEFGTNARQVALGKATTNITKQ
jgi:kinesin family protein C2/C3